MGRSWGFLASFSPIVRFGSPPGGQLTGAGYIPAPAQRGAIASRNSWICRIAGAIAAFSSGRLEQHRPNRPGFPILGLSCFVLALVSTPSYYDFGLVEVIAGGGQFGEVPPCGGASGGPPRWAPIGRSSTPEPHTISSAWLGPVCRPASDQCFQGEAPDAWNTIQGLK